MSILFCWVFHPPHPQHASPWMLSPRDGGLLRAVEATFCICAAGCEVHSLVIVWNMDCVIGAKVPLNHKRIGGDLSPTNRRDEARK